MDVALFHFRRYTATGLRKRLEAAGFEIEKLSYFMTFIAPLHIVYRVIHRAVFGLKPNPKYSLLELPTWVNDLFVWTNKVESRLIKFLSFPFGISVLVLARKK